MSGPLSGRRLAARASGLAVGAGVLGLALFPATRRALSLTDPWAPRARRIRRADRSLRRLTARHGLVFSVLLFLLPVWAARDLRPPSAVSAYSSLFGRIPWSDASNYHSGALLLLTKGTLDSFGARRPMNAALLAVRLTVTGGDLGRATVAQAILLGVAAWLAARAVGSRFGTPPGIVCLSVLLALGRPYVATALSEPLGLTLGCLGLALLVSGAGREPDTRALASGLFALALALGARAGALLALPVLAVAGIVVSRRRLAALGPILGASIVGAAVPIFLLRLYGAPDARPLSNFAPVALGLASGESDWKAVLANRPYLASLTENEAARAMYAEAWNHVRRDPFRVAATVGRQLSSYLREVPSYLTGAMAPPGATLPTALLLAGTALLAVARLVSGHGSSAAWLWAAAGAGILLSVPFVQGIGGMRVFAATDPFLAGFLALGARASDHGWNDRPGPRLRTRGAVLFVGALVLAAVVGPGLARRLVAVPRRPAPGPGEAIVQAPPIAVVVDSSLASPCVGAATMTRRAFREGLLAGSMEEADRLARQRPPFAFLVAYDPVEGRNRHFVGPVSLACADGPDLRIRTRPLDEGSALEEVVP